jgi:hypothetical protein
MVSSDDIFYSPKSEIIIAEAIKKIADKKPTSKLMKVGAFV